MSAHQVLLANLVRTAVFLILVGLVVRRRTGVCWTFVAYLSTILVCNSLISFWPETFFTKSFYLLKQSLYDTLKLAVAAELAYRVFHAFPGALAKARMVLAPLLALVTIGLISVPTSTDYIDIVTRYHPQIQTGVIWLMAATAVLAVWYNLPLHYFHRSILLGFTSYLIVFATLSNMLRSFGFDRLLYTVNIADSYAYLALVSWWAIQAWRSEEAVESVGAPQTVLATRAA